MLKAQHSWGLEPSDYKRRLRGYSWGVGIDLSALVEHLEDAARGTWTQVNVPTKRVNDLAQLLRDAGYEIQEVSVHDEDELYVRRPLEEA